MKNNKTILIVALVFVLVLGGAYALYSKLSPQFAPNQLATQPAQQTDPSGESGADETTEAVPVPDFVVYDIDGNEVHLSDFFGKPIVLNFWASWCGPCQMEMPDFDEKYQELGDEIHFVMVNITDGSRETVEKASEFIADKGFTFPVYYDTALNASNTYGAYSLPTTYFIDSEGYGTAMARGAIDADTLQRGIDMIYSK